MPFRTRPHIPLSVASPHYEASYKEVKENVFERVVSCDVQKLPPCENFDLDKMVEAGLPLEKVKTTIFDSAPSVDLLLQKSEKEIELNKNSNKE